MKYIIVTLILMFSYSVYAAEDNINNDKNLQSAIIKQLQKEQNNLPLDSSERFESIYVLNSKYFGKGVMNIIEFDEPMYPLDFQTFWDIHKQYYNAMLVNYVDNVGELILKASHLILINAIYEYENGK